MRRKYAAAAGIEITERNWIEFGGGNAAKNMDG
jgi:hypothetical protein